MDTLELPRELTKAIEKQERSDERQERDFGFGTTSSGLVLTKRYLGRLTEAFSEALNDNTKNNTKEAEILKLLKRLPVETVALSALQTCLHAVATKKPGLIFVTLALGSAVMHECWAHDLTEHSPKLAARVAKAAQSRHGNLKYRRQAARSAAKRAGFAQRFWERDLMAVAGGWLLGVTLKALPDVFTLDPVEGSTETSLGITDEALDYADNLVGDSILRHPYWLPMTTEPAPWTAWNQGGPADPRYFDNPTFIRAHHKDTQSAVKHAITTGQMAPAVEAVNALQSVAFTINQPVLNVIRECRARGLDVKGLPPVNNLVVPGKLPDHVWAAMDEDARRVRKLEIGAIKQANRGFNGERLLFAEDMATAESLAEQGRFWTPMNCDWRGRVYGMCHFNFQREDRVRSLFLFADGEPIGDEGLYWLKVHLANCGEFEGVHKRPFKERVEWADQFANKDLEIISLNPMHSSARALWGKAEKPFLFLAACKELFAALTAGKAFRTTLPVSFDGSCSGLQHLCAMTRAEEGKLVNLTASELPQDVYQTIGDRVGREVADDLDREFTKKDQKTKQVVPDPDPPLIAKRLLAYGVTRKGVKRNVMTYAYSSKKFGMAAQQQEDLMEPLALKVLKKELPVHPFAPFHKGSTERPSKASRYIGSKVFDTIEQEITRPAEAMRFLQKLAKALAHEGKPLRWVTPVGVPWINRYHEPETRVVRLWLYDKGVKIRTSVSVAVGEKSEIDKEKAANGVAPNFVHANDAAHLLLVARAAKREGITQLATVHDSFGCLASRAVRFNQIIREEFVRMYEDHDVLQEVLDQAKCDLTQANWNKLPQLPGRGGLNIKDVLNADFAFS